MTLEVARPEVERPEVERLDRKVNEEMLLAKVVGTVVSTQKSQNLTGLKLLILEPLDVESLRPTGKPLVAVDAVGAGESEVVLYVAGSSARLTSRTKDLPVDATVMAIVDYVEYKGRRSFSKS